MRYYVTNNQQKGSGHRENLDQLYTFNMSHMLDSIYFEMMQRWAMYQSWWYDGVHNQLIGCQFDISIPHSQKKGNDIKFSLLNWVQ